jgi:hypothetical protein
MSNRVRLVHETRVRRARREWWKRALIWAFIIVFAFSVAGGVIAITVSR